MPYLYLSARVWRAPLISLDALRGKTALEPAIWESKLSHNPKGSGIHDSWQSLAVHMAWISCRKILLLVFFGKNPKEQEKEASSGFGGHVNPGKYEITVATRDDPRKEL